MKKFYKSLFFALLGICYFLKHDRNGKIEIVIGIAVVLSGLLLRLSSAQWLIVLFCIGLVISLEMINSAIEKYCDMVTVNYNPSIKVIKDISAGAVLVASIASLVIGLIIYIPAIIKFINQVI